jgi:transposase
VSGSRLLQNPSRLPPANPRWRRLPWGVVTEEGLAGVVGHRSGSANLLVFTMAFRYLGAGRDQLYLMPVDIRDWLAPGHLAWFVLDVVEHLDNEVLHRLHANDGPGRPAYDPEVLLALLLYAYCTGTRSSRKIEQACQVDVAYRVICANQVPDHTTISRFRQAHDRFAQELFVQALALCARAGLVQVGVVAIDGTKMAADASMGANATMAQVEAELKAQVVAMFADAQAKDDDELFGRGDELPPAMADPRSRAAHLAAAKAQLDKDKAAQAERLAEAADKAEKAEAEAAAKGKRPKGRIPFARQVPRAEAGLASALAAARAGRAGAIARAGKPGAGPKEVEDYVTVQKARANLEKAKARAASPTAHDSQPSRFGEPKVNVTDPDSRVMKSRTGFIVGYNAQAAVGLGGTVVAAEVCQDAADSTQVVPMLEALDANLGAVGASAEVGTVLFDAGYWSEANATVPGPDRLIATSSYAKLQDKTAEGHREGPPPEGARPVEVMEHRLCSAEGSALYSKRATMVEPVFAQHKHVRGYRRMSRRGLVAAAGEWKLINTTHNILKLFRAGTVLASI